MYAGRYLGVYNVSEINTGAGIKLERAPLTTPRHGRRVRMTARTAAIASDVTPMRTPPLSLPYHRQLASSVKCRLATSFTYTGREVLGVVKAVASGLIQKTTQLVRCFLAKKDKLGSLISLSPGFLCSCIVSCFSAIHRGLDIACIFQIFP